MRERGPAGEAWIAFPYNGALDFADVAASQVLEYRMNFFGMIELRGRTAKATGGAANDVIGTLPTNYQPPANLRFCCTQGNAAFVISVQTTGNVVALAGATAGAVIDLSVIRFYPT